MHDCDVLIVGGGPGGSACASRLRRAGLDVLVVDRRAFPRDKPCAGWITPGVLEQMRIDPREYGAARVLQPIRGFRVSRMGGREIETDFGRVVSYGIRRCEFDHYLLLRAEARPKLGEAVRSIERCDGGWRINGALRAPLLVGAGGHSCPVARFVNGDAPGETVVAAQEIEFELDARQRAACPIRPDVPELYFCEDLVGYAWCFRKGDYLNIGIGREDTRRLAEHTAAFVDELRQRGRVPRDAPARFRGHAYVLYGHARRRLFDDRVVLLGDAAGLANARSGEGIRTAVESGLLAAEAIIAAAGDYQAERLAPYDVAVRSRLGRPGAGDGWLELVPTWLKLALARRLFETRWFTRRVVLEGWFLGGLAHAAAVQGAELLR